MKVVEWDRYPLVNPIDILVERAYNMSMDKNKQMVWDILSTPNNVDFKKYRETHDMTWLTQGRQVVWIEDMETKHIIACVNMLERLGQEYTAAYTGLINELGTRHKDQDLWEWGDEN